MKEYSFEEFEEMDKKSERVKKIIDEENKYNYVHDELDFEQWYYCNIKWITKVLNDKKIVRKEKLKELNK